MNRLAKYVAMVALSGLICGCETTNSTGQTASSSAYVHTATKFSFPKSIGVFERGKVDKFDREGKDMGVGYNAPTPIAATVFVYPGPKDFSLVPAPKSESVSETLLARHFEQCKGDVFRANTDAKLLTETNFTLVQGENKFHGKKATFSMNYRFGSSSRESTSELYVFVMEPGLKFFSTDRYFVTYRITYPSNKAPEAEPQITEWMTNLSWPVK